MLFFALQGIIFYLFTWDQRLPDMPRFHLRPQDTQPDQKWTFFRRLYNHVLIFKAQKFWINFSFTERLKIKMKKIDLWRKKEWTINFLYIWRTSKWLNFRSRWKKMLLLRLDPTKFGKSLSLKNFLCLPQILCMKLDGLEHIYQIFIFKFFSQS